MKFNKILRAVVYLSLPLLANANISAEPFIDSSLSARLSNSKLGVASYLDGQSRTQSLSCGGAHTIPQNGFFFSSTQTTLTEYDKSFAIWHHCRDSGTSSKAWGQSGDVPVVGDYNGDGYSDYSVFRPSNNTWYIAYQVAGTTTGTTEEISFGVLNDTPFAFDLEGDGKDNLCVFRVDSSSGGTKFLCRNNSSTTEEISMGLLGDRPIFGVKNSIGRELFALFRPLTGVWYVRATDGSISNFQLGLPGDIPMGSPIIPASTYTPILYRPREAKWYVSDAGTVSSISFGSLGSKPSSESRVSNLLRYAQSDVDGDSLSDLVVVRKKSDTLVDILSLRTSALSAAYRTPQLPVGDKYIQGDFDGDLLSDFASVKTDLGALTWSLYLSGSQQNLPTIGVLKYGLAKDTLVPADYDGDGRLDLAVTRSYPSQDGTNYLWWIPLASGATPLNSFFWGFDTDTALVGDVDGDQRADAVVVRKVPQGLLWLGRSNGNALEPFLFGLETDTPHLYDLNGDGILEAVVERNVDGFKYYYSRAISKTTPAFQWGLEGDTVFSLFKRGLSQDSLGVWRIINGQGYFFIRSEGLQPISLPFGVQTDTPLIEVISNAISLSSSSGSSSSVNTSSTTSTSTTSSSSIARVSCDGTSSINAQERGFVWKPISDSDGKLAVLFGSGRAGKIAGVTLVERKDTGDVILESLKFAYNSNGNRPTFRAKRAGRSYPTPLIMVRQDSNGYKECITVNNPGQRVG